MTGLPTLSRRARRVLLSTGIAASAMLTALSAHAASPADVGSWGQAWGDDETPQPQAIPQPRGTQPAPQASTIVQTPVPPPISTAPSSGVSSADMGGWGQAWTTQTAQPQRQAVQQAPAPTQSAPVATASPAPSPADIGGWGQAWNGPAPRAEAPLPTRTVPVSTQPSAAAMASQPTSAPAAAPAVSRPSTPVAPQTTSDVPPPSSAPIDDSGHPPIRLAADQIVHDKELGIVTARGHVEIVQAGQTLTADQVSYNLKQDVVSASGNVIIVQPDGEVMATNYFELTGDFREGVAEEIRSILVDNSSMTATDGRRTNGNRIELSNGTYTACEPCRAAHREPLWQVKADKVVHDQEKKVIEYDNAWLELGGVPVAYTPYLSHPDPTVKRKSGFLIPTAGTSSNLGTNFTVPYFWNIKDNQDITFAPRFLFTETSNGSGFNNDNTLMRHLVLAGEHRWVGASGEARTVASITQDRHDGDWRGHIDATARFDIDNSWRAGYQIQRASDDTYNSVYSYPIVGDRPWLTTRPYTEYFGRRNYFRAEAFAFQGLRESDDPGESPIVLPHITSSQITAPDSRGGYYTMDTDFLSYARSEGTSATRASSTVGWHRPFMGSLGDITTVSTTMRADAYHGEDVDEYGSTNAGRAVPTVSANWRMPFVRESRSLPQVIEPMVMVAASPNGGNSDRIPNEDSLGFELDELNVFQTNRLPGMDRVEGGLRGAYGLRWQAYPSRGGWVNATVAQGWRAHADNTFGQGSGFDDTLSDYLGQLEIAPNANLALSNRVRLDHETGELRRNENTLSLGPRLFRNDVTYLMMEPVRTEEEAYPRRHYVSWDVTSALTQNWKASTGVRYDLSQGGGPIGWRARLLYDDECFAFLTDFRQDYTYQEDDVGGFSVTFNIVFKTLGEVPFNAF